MRLFGRSAASAASGHSAEPEPCCTVSAETASAPNAMSPARLLARSLTSCDTRDEWARKYDPPSPYGHRTEYINAKRDLKITSGYTYGLGLYGGGGRFVSTPFTLTKAEEEIVFEALDAFNARLKTRRRPRRCTVLPRPRQGHHSARTRSGRGRRLVARPVAKRRVTPRNAPKVRAATNHHYTSGVG
jgi:hypothetical protein